MYEVIITTGFGNDAGTNETVEFSLIYNGENTISQPLRPGQNSLAGNAYQQGQLDLCRDCDFKSSDGSSLNVDGITAVRINFHGKKWCVHKVWITNVDTGHTVCSGGEVWVGDETPQGQIYDLPLAPDIAAAEATAKLSPFFDFVVKTSDLDKSDTNDTVHFKLFGADGRASECHRAQRRGNQYEQGATDVIKGFFTSYWVKGVKIFGDDILDIDIDSQPFAIDTRIHKVLIFKEQDSRDGWRPERLEVTSSLKNGPNNVFELTDQLQGNGILDGDYRWCYAEVEPLP